MKDRMYVFAVFRLKHIALAMVAISVFCATLFVYANTADALRVSMKRIIFEGPKRSDVITIINNTAEEQTYRLGWRKFRMDEADSLVAIDENKPEDKAHIDKIKWADEMIRFAPRRVTVPAGGSQQVRLLLRKKRDLPEGEYRAHIWIVTEAEAVSFEEQQNSNERSFQLNMNPAITMPVFVRHGNLTVKAGIEELRYRQNDGGKGQIVYNLTREGNRSIYGDVRIICTGGGAEHQVHQVRGLAVYPEVNFRSVRHTFDIPEDKAAVCRSLRVEFYADDSDPQFANQMVASAQATVQ